VAVVEQMGAPGAFLADLEFVVFENSIVRACFTALAAAIAFFGVEYDKPVLAAIVRAVFARFHARRFFAVVAQLRDIVDFYFGNRAAHVFLKLQPELAYFRLRFRVWRPIIADMFVLARELAVIAPVAF